MDREALRLQDALGRTFETQQLGWSMNVAQICPLCGVKLGASVGNSVPPARLHEQLFELYDAHRCAAANDPRILCARAERALATAPTRISAISDPELRVRAQREAVAMEQYAKELRARLGGTVEDEARRLAEALGRAFEYDAAYQTRTTFNGQHHIVQVCPLCEARLGLWIELDNVRFALGPLHRQLFSLYDQHRCVIDAEPHAMFERAERALVTAAERIGAVSDPQLRARAEAEADRMAEAAQQLRGKLSGY